MSDQFRVDIPWRRFFDGILTSELIGYDLFIFEYDHKPSKLFIIADEIGEDGQMKKVPIRECQHDSIDHLKEQAQVYFNSLVSDYIEIPPAYGPWQDTIDSPGHWLEYYRQYHRSGGHVDNWDVKTVSVLDGGELVVGLTNDCRWIGLERLDRILERRKEMIEDNRYRFAYRKLAEITNPPESMLEIKP